MGVKVYSLNEAPEVPSPEVPAPTPGDVVAVGEAYENVSMLEFACLVHEYEQNMFDAVIATDFMEAVQEQVMLEADGDEAAADSTTDANDSADAGDAEKKSLGDKIKNSKVGQAAKAMKDKVVELIRAFLRKIEEWVQKLRVKFGDLFKADQKIANWMSSISDWSDVEKDGRWKTPAVNYTLMERVFENRFDEFWIKSFNDADAAVKKLFNTIKSARSMDAGQAAEDIKTARDEAKAALETAKKNCISNIENVYNAKEAGKGENGIKAVSLNKASSWFKNATNGNTITNLVKTANDSKASLKTMESEIQSFTAEDESINKLAMAAFNDIVADYTTLISKATTTLASAQARAYADLRKFCLTAVSVKKQILNKGNKEVKQESVELEQWAICEASDEFVFETLALI